jgi:hypothetical protein
MARPNAQTDGLRLDESHEGLEAGGFAQTLRTAKAGRILCMACGLESPASQFKVLQQKRVEGVSDPAEESLVLGLECPACDARGTLTLAYGPRAGRDEAAILAALPPPQR